MLSNRAIITFEDARVSLKLEDQDEEYQDMLEQIIDSVSLAIEDATQQFYREKTIEEIVDGNGQTSFWTNYIPIKALASVSFYDGTEWQNVTGSTYNYTLRHNSETGEIYFDERYAIFPKGNNSIKINYTAGYAKSEVPKNIKQAATLLMMIYFQQYKNNRVGVDTHSFGDQSISYDTADWPADVKRLLRIK